MKEIFSRQNQIIKFCAKLKAKKYRNQEGMFLVEGSRAVNDIVNKYPDCVECILVDNIDLCDSDKCHLTSSEIIDYLSETKSSQGIIAVVKKRDFIFDSTASVLILDRVRDPGNLGTLIRTAVSCGFYNIYLYDCADVYNSKVVRSTMSGIVRANICENMQYSMINDLKAMDYKIFGADMNGISCYEYNGFCEKVGLVMGNEANGLSDEMSSLCDDIISLPMSDSVESLNVAVCGSILMYNIKYLGR